MSGKPYVYKAFHCQCFWTDSKKWEKRNTKGTRQKKNNNSLHKTEDIFRGGGILKDRGP